MVTFVVYYVEISEELEKRIVGLQPRFQRYHAIRCIELLAASARKAHPDSRFVILTNHRSEIPQIEGVEIKRYSFDADRFVVARVESSVAFLEHAKHNSHTIFLDIDMLVQRSLDPLFQHDYDVGLSYRHAILPLNGGLVIIPKGKERKGIEFFNGVKRIILHDFPHLEAWQGAQEAFIQFVGREKYREHKAQPFRAHEILFQFFSCRIYNYTYDKEELVAVPDKYILHFKGPRKKWMEPYWQQILNAEK